MQAAGLCTFCQKSVGEEALLAMDKLWHREHFLCANCDNPVEHGFKRDETNRPLCLTCHTNIYNNTKCSGCGQSLQDKCILTENKQWHAKCFVCTSCKKPFSKGEYFLFQDFPYDMECHWQKQLELHLAQMAEQQGREAKKE